MDVARDLLRTLPADALPLLVVADVQTAGRGRMGRPWEAPAGSALLMSLAFRPTWLPPEHGPALVWMAAVALCEAIEMIGPLRPSLKWPNDVMLAQQGGGLAKAAGLLLEVSTGAAGIEWAIIGCGVNVSAAPPSERLRYPATSLVAASGRPVSRLELLRALLRRLDAWHARLARGERDGLFAAWRGRLSTIGQEVLVETPGGPVRGLAEDVDARGSLLVREATGALRTVSAGDVGLLA